MGSISYANMTTVEWRSLYCYLALWSCEKGLFTVCFMGGFQAKHVSAVRLVLLSSQQPVLGARVDKQDVRKHA